MSNLNQIISFIFSTIDALIFINILSIFKKDKYNNIFTYIVKITVISIIIFALTLLGISPYMKIIIISVILFTITFIYKMKLYERLLIVILYYFIIIISELLITYLISNILNIELNSIPFAYEQSYLFLGTISKFLEIIITSIVKRKLSNERVALPWFLNYILISILLLANISMIMLFSATLSMFSNDIYSVLFLICLFFLLISAGVLIIYFSANRSYITLQKETTKQIYNKSYEKFIINSRKKEDSLSKIWHDLNNHIRIMEKMCELDNNIVDYLNSLKDEINSIPNNINSGNKLINIIINDKYLEALSHKIILDIKALVPPKLSIDDLDLSSILFNTIDNSIEACIDPAVKNKYIYIELYTKGNFLYYKIKNSCNYNNNSTKKRYFKKIKYITGGYGLKIVEDIVDKYNGTIDIFKGDSEYSVTIILHLETSNSINNHII